MKKIALKKAFVSSAIFKLIVFVLLFSARCSVSCSLPLICFAASIPLDSIKQFWFRYLRNVLHTRRKDKGAVTDRNPGNELEEILTGGGRRLVVLG